MTECRNREGIGITSPLTTNSSNLGQDVTKGNVLRLLLSSYVEDEIAGKPRTFINNNESA